MSADKKVSVIMPVYNVEKYIAESIESVLNQTHTNLELVIVDDCTPDGSMDIARKYDDPRIVLCKNPVNLGLAQARNTGIRASTGDYIAMLDSDDISTPDRLKIQIEYLEAHPDIGICGTGYKFFGNDEKTPRQRFIGTDELKTLFAFYPGFHCTTIMFRRSLMFDNNLFYWEDKDWICEDYDICMRGIEIMGIDVIPDCLYLYRKHDTQLTTNDIGYKRKTAKLAGTYISRKLNDLLSPDDLQTYIDMASEKDLEPSEDYYNQITDICTRILRANDEKKVFIPEIFTEGIALRWYRGIKPYLKSKSANLSKVKQEYPYRFLNFKKKLNLTLRGLVKF